MNIGIYSFEEFKTIASAFHGYPSPGIVIGAYMVELAKTKLPKDILFEALAESQKCLPDAIQLLTPCTIGNNRLKIHKLGIYALSLFDKYSGDGVRVSLDCTKLSAFPEIKAWFFKEKDKVEQNEFLLLQEIEKAGDSICKFQKIQINAEFIGHQKMKAIIICPKCQEAYPTNDGNTCLACQGQKAYHEL